MVCTFSEIGVFWDNAFFGSLLESKCFELFFFVKLLNKGGAPKNIKVDKNDFIPGKIVSISNPYLPFQTVVANQEQKCGLSELSWGIASNWTGSPSLNI